MSMKSSCWTIVVALMVAAAGCDGGAATSTIEPEPVPDVALNADGRLDLATLNVEKAILLLLVAENPITRNPDRPFGGHRAKAVFLLERAQKEVAAAGEYADDPRNQP